jgi:hypothetical protein
VQQWTGVPLTFTAALSWTVEHDWGTFQPYVVVTRDDGRPMLIGPEYTDGQVVITFHKNTAGTISLHGPLGGIAEIATPPRASSLPSATSATSAASASAVTTPRSATTPATITRDSRGHAR